MGRRKRVGCPDELDPTQRRSIIRWVNELVARGDLPEAYRERPKLRELWDQCRNHHQFKATLGVDWEKGFRKWITKQAEIEGFKPPRMRRKPRAQPAQAELFRDGEMEPIAAILGKLGR